jgi:hypothetical protein
MAGAMTEIRDDICSISVVVFETVLIFLYSLWENLLFYVCHKMTVLEELNREK